MDRFSAMATFRDVVDTGSFVRAAERQGISVSAVSRQIAELEAHLGARLLNRTTRRLSLTETGRAYHERCVQLLADVEEAEEVARAGTGTVRGTLRITAPVTFGARQLAPVIAEFVNAHPEIRLDMELSDRAVDLVDEGFDLAVRIGLIGSQNLVGRKVGETKMICCASPTYLDRHGRPAAPRDLEKHACLTYEYASTRNAWHFRDREGADLSVRVSGAVHANNGRFLEALAVAGLGVVYEPDFTVGPDILAGRLERVLPGFEPPPSPVYVVYASRRHLSAKVRAFADHVAESFRTMCWRIDEPS